MPVLSETLWSPRLRDYAAFVHASHATDARRCDVAHLLGNRPARDQFIQRWRTWVFYFRRCLQQPGWFDRDPERLDEAVVELRSYARFAPREQWQELHAILDEIAWMADQTRHMRQQLHVSRHLRLPIASA
ncbi:hypothetical protein HY635_03310 [Candidatus Uhrbacteria bacterium]|nr:hypothetical protein [Candidatus Uhrbacteria bacterium]